ncbi:MAG: hypothetical protein ACLFV7_01320 [Phycisphaerae bacterium]
MNGRMMLALAGAAMLLSAASADDSLLISDGKSYSSSYWNIDDGAGYRWDVYSTYGYINSGTDSAYSTSMYLYVNNNNFYSNTRQVSKDGRELQIGPWRYGNVQVYRRIYIDPKLGYARYIDIFQNVSGQDQNVSIRYNINAGSSIQKVYTTSGKNELSEKDWGCVSKTSSNSLPDTVHIWSSRGSKVSPTFSWSANNNTMHYNMNLSIPAGKTHALCFFEAQRKPYDKAQKFLRREFSLSAEMAKVPPALRKIIVNMGGPVITIGSLELPRNEKQDLCVTLGENEFLGTILNESYEIETFYGKLSLSADKVVGLSVPDVNDDHVLVGLVDGQVVGGKLLNGPLRLKLTTGSEMSLPTSKIKTFAYRISKEKPSEISAKKSAVVLRSGQQLFFRDSDADVGYLTEYGQIRLNSKNLRGIRFDTADGGLHRVFFRNGSVLSGLVVDDQLKLTLALGKTLDIRRHLAERFAFSGSDVNSADMAMLQLRNEDILYGTIVPEKLVFRTSFGEAPVEPNQVASIEFLARPIGKVKVKLKSGSTIEGYFPKDQKTLPFQLEPGPRLNVYLGHIVSITIPEDYGKEPEKPETVDDGKDRADSDNGDGTHSSLSDEERKKIETEIAAIDDKIARVREMIQEIQQRKARADNEDDRKKAAAAAKVLQEQLKKLTTQKKVLSEKVTP